MSSIWGAIYQATFGAYQEWRDGRRRKAQAQREDAMLDRAMSKRDQPASAGRSGAPDEKTEKPSG